MVRAKKKTVLTVRLDTIISSIIFQETVNFQEYARRKVSYPSHDIVWISDFNLPRKGHHEQKGKETAAIKKEKWPSRKKKHTKLVYRIKEEFPPLTSPSEILSSLTTQEIWSNSRQTNKELTSKRCPNFSL